MRFVDTLSLFAPAPRVDGKTALRLLLRALKRSASKRKARPPADTLAHESSRDDALGPAYQAPRGGRGCTRKAPLFLARGFLSWLISSNRHSGAVIEHTHTTVAGAADAQASSGIPASANFNALGLA